MGYLHKREDTQNYLVVQWLDLVLLLLWLGFKRWPGN